MKNKIKIFLLAAFVLLGMGYTIAATSPEVSALAMPGGAFLSYANKFGGEITKKEILAHKALNVDGCAAGSRIFSYQIEITKSGKVSTFTAESDTLSKEIMAALKELSAGDSFEFKRVKAYWGKRKDDVVDVHSKKFVVADNPV